MYSVILLAVCLPTLAYALTCLRCFGNGFCHDPRHSEFLDGIRNATCDTTSYWSDSGNEDSFITEVERVLNAEFKKNFGQVSAQDTELEQNCLTATVHEPHDSYTLRTCVPRLVPTEGTYPSLCELVQEYIQSQNFYNGSFLCKQCNDGDFCNTHALLVNEDDEGKKDEPSSANIRVKLFGLINLLITILLVLSL